MGIANTAQAPAGAAVLPWFGWIAGGNCRCVQDITAPCQPRLWGVTPLPHQPPGRGDKLSYLCPSQTHCH